MDFCCRALFLLSASLQNIQGQGQFKAWLRVMCIFVIIAITISIITILSINIMVLIIVNGLGIYGLPLVQASGPHL